MTLLSEEHFSVKTPILGILTLLLISVFFSSNASANTCSKSDIDYYLQRGFTNDQVVQLCAGVANQNTNQQNYQAPTQAQTQQSQQNNQLREDQSYLSAALDADGVSMTPQSLTLMPRECIEYGPPNNIDLVETICVTTKININFAGMNILKSSKGLFLVRDATVKVKGNIKREFVGINDLRRQDREAVLEVLKPSPSVIDVKVRRGIDPRNVAIRLKKYAK